MVTSHSPLVDDRLGGDRTHGLIELYGNRAAAEEALRRVLRESRRGRASCVWRSFR
jgi:hypothetical protein